MATKPLCSVVVLFNCTFYCNALNLNWFYYLSVMFVCVFMGFIANLTLFYCALMFVFSLAVILLGFLVVASCGDQYAERMAI